MDPQAAKLIGAGIAAVALGGAGIGIGHVFGNYLAGALRNPAAAASQRGMLFLGFAFAEATGLIGFAVAMLILYG
jgi:F-type H+-transporting ATPase subunit c